MQELPMNRGVKSAWVSPEILPACPLQLSPDPLPEPGTDSSKYINGNHYRGFWAKFGQEQAHFLL